MAILFTQPDGSDQHYDTYEEFEQAFILLKRLNGEKVPQDLLDEVKAKYGDKDTEPFKVEIDGNNFESAISEEVKKATRELAEALDEVAKDRTPVSDECENPETEPKFKVGDKVYLTEEATLDVTYGKAYEVVGFGEHPETGKELFEILDDRGHEHSWRLKYIESIEETDLELVEDSTEFRTGDIVKVTETFEDIHGDVAESGTVCEYVGWSGSWRFAGTVLIGDNIDKLRLVCRKEDRKDIEL